MRTTKRFTPAVLERFLREERGHGIYSDYIPWHRVSRSDPSSRGRSHLVMWRSRQRELLSDNELVAFLFSSMLPNLVDLREQFPLANDSNVHELASYYPSSSATIHAGTLEMAQMLGFKHPISTGDGRSTPWIMTTDLLLTLSNEDSIFSLLAISIKGTDDLEKKRTKELLSIEREYWKSRGVPWLLITPNTFNKKIGIFLKSIMPWVFDNEANEHEFKIAAQITRENPHYSLTRIWELIANSLDSDNEPQTIFWQAVWRGIIPLDLERGWRPHLPAHILTQAEYMNQNPVAARRSSWI